MTDDPKQAAADPKTEAAPASDGVADDPEKKIAKLEAKLSGLHTQVHERDTELETLRAFKTEREQAERAAEQKRLVEAGEFEELKSSLEKEKTALAEELLRERTERIVNEAMSDLANEVKSKAARRHIAEQWAVMDSKAREADGAWNTFVEAQRKDDPETFEQRTHTPPGDRGGAPGQASPASTKDGLVVKDGSGYYDLEKMSANIAEARRKLMSGGSLD